MPEFPTLLTRYAKGHPVTRQAIALAGFAFLSTPIGAAGLGEIRILSALGERFDATVSVALTEGEAISPACFQITELREEGDIHVLRRARIEYRKTGQGGEVRIHGTEYEQEPLLKVALRLRCPEEDTRGITREYSVLLDPREYKTAATPVAAIVPPATQPDSTTRLKPAPATPSARSHPVTAAGQRAASRQKQAKPPRATPRPVSTEPEEFRLQLSTAPIDPARANITLTEEQKLQLRERLLLLEADDQTAQLLQLKDRIARLEKQLTGMPPQAALQSAQAAPSKLPATNNPAIKQEESISAWLLAALGALLLIPLGFVIWRRKARNQDEQELFAFDNDFEHTATLTPVQKAMYAPVAPAAPASASSPARNEEWGTDNMDVVSPETVAEEAQLLLDHGLTHQAIDLLLQETTHRPTALALWMKLFDAYCLAGDRKGFEAQASSFRGRFVSEALWQQVQSLGRSIDPTNPLYVKEAQTSDDLVMLVDGLAPSRNDGFDNDFDVIDLLQRQTPEQSLQNKAAEPAEIELPLEFHLPEVSSADMSEWSAQSGEHAGKPLFDIDTFALNPPPLPETVKLKSLEPEDFSSADPHMQGIAHMIFSGQRNEACQQLEELLYRGSFDQRLLAAKWLDKLLPVKNSF